MAPLTRMTHCTGMHWAETGLQISCTEQPVFVHYVLKILQIVVPHKLFAKFSNYCPGDLGDSGDPGNPRNPSHPGGPMVQVVPVFQVIKMVGW